MLNYFISIAPRANTQTEKSKKKNEWYLFFTVLLFQTTFQIALNIFLFFYMLIIFEFFVRKPIKSSVKAAVCGVLLILSWPIESDSNTY